MYGEHGCNARVATSAFVVDTPSDFSMIVFRPLLRNSQQKGKNGIDECRVLRQMQSELRLKSGFFPEDFETTGRKRLAAGSFQIRSTNA
jgi:hypothetical protein